MRSNYYNHHNNHLAKDKFNPKAKIIATRATVYHSSCIDLTHSVTVHSVDHTPCILDPTFGLEYYQCQAVHRGLCSPLEQPSLVHYNLATLNRNTANNSQSSKIDIKSGPSVATNSSQTKTTDSYFDKIQAAIQLLADEEEPQNLEDFLRSFVREDRRRQQNKKLFNNKRITSELEAHQTSSTASQQNSVPESQSTNNQTPKLEHRVRDQSPGRIIKIKQKLPQQVKPDDKLEKNDNISRTTSSSHFHSRLSKFEQQSINEKPNFYQLSDGTLLNSKDEGEKQVYGLNSKSSLTRHKQIIENRTHSPSPPPDDSGTVNKLFKSKQDKQLELDNLDNLEDSLSLEEQHLFMNQKPSAFPDPNSNNNNNSNPTVINRVLTDDEKVILQKTETHLTTKPLSGNESSLLQTKNNTEGAIDNEKFRKRIISVPKPKPSPAPKPTEQQKPTPKVVKGKLIFGVQTPVKPTGGSVAERVLMFERCPPERTSSKKTSGYKNDRITGTKVGSKVAPLKVVSPSCDDWIQKSDLTNDQLRNNKNVQDNKKSLQLQGSIPKFYYPRGRPYSTQEITNQLNRIREAFFRFPGRQAARKEFASVLRYVGLPLYWKEPIFQAVLSTKSANGTGTGTVNGGGNKNKISTITCEEFSSYWKRIISTCYDEASRFLTILTFGQRNYLVPEDLAGLVQDVIETHPGLSFLKDAIEFHSRYIATVISRIFYNVNRSWSGKVTLPELRASNLLQTLRMLEEEDDINQITEYFSYEHFYVIYCKFWELDKDHDLFISKYDLSKHSDGAISSKMIERIFSGAVTHCKNSLLSYSEFVWFLLAEEDKRHPRAIEYWFRAMDLDGDGYLSYYELEYFYSEQVRRMDALGIESLPFTDCLCQMIDLVHPKIPDRISLADLKKCALTTIFFDTFFNLDKYLNHEQRDPFANNKDEDGLQMTDWERYAAEEYEYLVAEESAQSHLLTNFIGGQQSVTKVYINSNGECYTRREDDDYDYDYDYVDSDNSDYEF